MFEKIAYYLITFLLGILLALHWSKAILPDPQEFADVSAQLEEALTMCPENLICYEPYGVPVQAEYVMDGSLVAITFVDESDMPTDTEAYATYYPDFETNMSVCVITAQFPTHILGDPIMDSIGHEFLHCIVGDFHP